MTDLDQNPEKPRPSFNVDLSALGEIAPPQKHVMPYKSLGTFPINAIDFKLHDVIPMSEDFLLAVGDSGVIIMDKCGDRHWEHAFKIANDSPYFQCDRINANQFFTLDHSGRLAVWDLLYKDGEIICKKVNPYHAATVVSKDMIVAAKGSDIVLFYKGTNGWRDYDIGGHKNIIKGVAKASGGSFVVWTENGEISTWKSEGRSFNPSYLQPEVGKIKSVYPLDPDKLLVNTMGEKTYLISRNEDKEWRCERLLRFGALPVSSVDYSYGHSIFTCQSGNVTIVSQLENNISVANFMRDSVITSTLVLDETTIIGGDNSGGLHIFTNNIAQSWTPMVCKLWDEPIIKLRKMGDDTFAVLSPNQKMKLLSKLNGETLPA